MDDREQRLGLRRGSIRGARKRRGEKQRRGDTQRKETTHCGRTVVNHASNALSFVDGKKSVIECHGKHRHRRTERRPPLTAKAAVRLLPLLESPDRQRVPLFPGNGIALKKGLRLVIAAVFRIPLDGL